MLKAFNVPDGLVGRLVDEPADSACLDLLSRGQLNKHVQLTTFIAKTVPEESATPGPAVSLLSEVQRNSPDHAKALLGAPLFGSWAGRTARRLLGKAPATVPLNVELSYLNATAVVAAKEAGIDAELPLYIRQGMVVLPSLGAARSDLPEFSPVRARVHGGRLTLDGIPLPDDLGQETPNWMPTRRLRMDAAGQEFILKLEDLDYYRDCYGKDLTGRLSDADFNRLAGLLSRAWHLLVNHLPGRARELSAGLSVLVPFSTQREAPGLSATSATAYGAFGLTIPERPDHLASTLVHEYQHSKLSALMDLRPLYDKTATRMYFAPWKPAPRPLWGALQGAFAFLAVAEYWGRLHQAGIGNSAEKHFADLRLQVDTVLNQLATEPALNDLGRRFVGRMREVMAKLMEIRVSRAAESASARKLADIETRWRESNAAAALI